jgi:hypothetical protein
MSTETVPSLVTKAELDTTFEAVVRLIKAAGSEAHARVAAHIRAVSDGRFGHLAQFHNADSISATEKRAQYILLSSALGLTRSDDGKVKLVKPDWTKLQGQLGAGAKKADEEEPVVSPPPRFNPEPPQPSNEIRRQIIPAEDPKPAATTASPSNEALGRIMADIVREHLHLKPEGTQAVDEGHIRLIVNEELVKLDIGEQVKKANLNGAFPTDRVTKLIEDALAKTVQRIEIIQPNGDTKPLHGLIHPQVPQLCAYLRAGVPAWAHSAAGSGKTHMARQIAEMLGVEPYVISIDPTITVSKLLGYRNVANGEFVEGFIYKAYKHGGLVALDEVDTGDPGVVASINALLSNTHYLFPNNETIKRHDQFYLVAMANTKGTGAVAGYTARNKLDAATLDRFAIVEIKYDPGLELALAIGEGTPGKLWQPVAPATIEVQRAYVEWVQKVRAEVGNSVLISPRASINGCKLLRAGVPVSEVVEALVFKLCASDTVTRIKDRCGLPEGATV